MCVCGGGGGVWACVCLQRGSPTCSHGNWTHARLHVRTDVRTKVSKKKRKKENPWVHISVTTSPVLMTPLVSPSARIYLSTRSLWVQLLRLPCACVYVLMCAFQSGVWAVVCVSASAHIFCPSLKKLKSPVATNQRIIEFGHTCDGTQPPASPLLCLPPPHHPIIPLLFLLNWAVRGRQFFWHLGNPVFEKLCRSIIEALIACLESITQGHGSATSSVLTRCYHLGLVSTWFHSFSFSKTLATL